jgi:hypothetical protein
VDGEPGSGPIVPPDPVPPEPCDPLAQLGRIPREVPDWTLRASPIFPYEFFAGTAVGFVGRLFHSARVCVVVAAGRPADPDGAINAVLEEHQARTTDVHGRLGVVMPSVGANQVTLWVRDAPDRLLMLRAFGAIDPDVLTPFLEALFPADAADGGADAVEPADASADTADAASRCPPRNPFPDEYDPEAFYGPPGDCWL